MNLPIPGSRVVIRDEEWLVRRADHTTDGGQLLTVDGVSDLVRGRSSLFLTALEDQIVILEPAKTKLVPDTSRTYQASLLYLESQRRRTTANDAMIHLGHQGVMNLVPYQLDPALQALRRPRARILIADAVGLGKTLEAGILATELIQRGRGKRILVVTQKSMLTQFQKEWWSRFSIPLVRLDSVGLARVRNRIPANHNPFNHFDRSIISIDTLKSNLEYRNYLENAWWDIIVIDECHNVAARAGEQGLSRRARLARILATRSDSLILLSATPHDGSARSFASLVSLLDPTAISAPDDYTRDDFRHKGLVVRRFKKDIKDQVSNQFQERITTCLRQQASALEEDCYRALLAIRFTQLGSHGKQQELQRVAMQKALFSSPAAALQSTEKRLALLQNKSEPSNDEQGEMAGLEQFATCLRTLDASAFGKYQRLLQHLADPGFGWQRHSPHDRIVIFSERIETLSWLRGQMQADFGFKDKELAILHGQMTDTEQQQLVERFGRLDDPIRLLLCSDVAAEGLNLHYFCHRLIHFDLPWSLMVFQQRNGRVDRYGQTAQPHIVYLFTETTVEKISGDLRILEILEQKDEQANLNLGDPALFLNVYDPDKESDKVSELMAGHTSPEAVEALLDSNAANAANTEGDTANEGDWLLQLFSGAAEPNQAESEAADDSLSHLAQTPSLFDNTYQFAKAALAQLESLHIALQWQSNDLEQSVVLTAPPDLQERLRQLPREVQAANDQYTLCADVQVLTQAIETARQARAEEDTWPQLHYLWQQHPIMEWLFERMLTHFGRHCAPLLASPHLAAGTQAFIMLSLVPNRKGQPLLVEWQVASRARAEDDFVLEAFEAFAARAGLQAGKLPNRGQELPFEAMQQAMPQAVQKMARHMAVRQREFARDMAQRLQGTLDELARLQGNQIQQLELQLEKVLETVASSRFERRKQQIARVFDDYRNWVQDSLTTEPNPTLAVLAAVYGTANASQTSKPTSST